MNDQRYIANSEYGDYQEKIAIDFDPSQHETPEAAAKAFYEALKPVVKSYGQDPEIECGIYDPETASQREYGHTWVVWWEAGPYQWGIVAQTWLHNTDAGWFTEPHFSFDVCFTEV
jgi:hypothetical protein